MTDLLIMVEIDPKTRAKLTKLEPLYREMGEDLAVRDPTTRSTTSPGLADSKVAKGRKVVSKE